MEGSTDLWLRNPIFRAAGEEACAQLARRFPATVHAAGAVIAEAGVAADLHVLLRGAVRVYQRTADGREAVSRLLDAPAVFGDAELLRGLPMLESVAAIDEVEVAVVPAEAYLELLGRSPAAMRQHLVHAAGALCVWARASRLVFATLEQRIANLLLSFADRFGVPLVRGGVELGADLSNLTIARSLGAVRRSVIKVMRRWGEEGTIARRAPAIILLRPDVLEGIAAPIRGSLWHGAEMSLDGLAQKDRLDLGLVEVVDDPGGLLEVGDDLVFGSAPGATLRVPVEAVCPRHCRIHRGATGARYWVEDLDSVTGTRLNGAPVRRCVLHDGDLIEVGPIQLRFRLRRQACHAAA